MARTASPILHERFNLEQSPLFLATLKTLRINSESASLSEACRRSLAFLEFFHEKRLLGDLFIVRKDGTEAAFEDPPDLTGRLRGNYEFSAPVMRMLEGLAVHDGGNNAAALRRAVWLFAQCFPEWTLAPRVVHRRHDGTVERYILLT